MTAYHPILHVEDRSTDVLLLELAFQRADIRNPVRVATDGQEAIDYLAGSGKFADRKQFPLPCIVLLDVNMPRKSGLEVLEWIRGQPTLRWLIVIILTASVNERDVQSAYDLGVNAFLIKPSELNTLIDMCQALKHFWLTHNQPPAQCAERL